MTNQSTSLIHNGILQEPLATLSVVQLVELLQEADDAYFNGGEPLLTDKQYDDIKSYASLMDPVNVYFTGVGASIRGNKVKLPYCMGSLDQVHPGEFIKWISKHNLTNEMLLISHKLDGSSNMVVYHQGVMRIAYSRGDGTHGADITRHMSNISSLPANITKLEPFTIRGETIITPHNFKLMLEYCRSSGNKLYKNPRNAISGLMNSSTIDPQLYQFIDVVAYEIVGSELSKHIQLEILSSFGFKTVESILCEAKNTTDKSLTAMLEQARKISQYELDGIVIEANNSVVRKLLQTTNLNPAYAVKFKTNQAVIATVVDVEFSVSKDGFLKPRVNIVPTELMGVTIQYLTGFNAKFIKDNNIGPDSIINICRAGDVIPTILYVSKPSSLLNDQYTTWFTNKLDSFGDWQWNSTSVDAVLIDSSTNTDAILGTLVDFFNTLEVDHLGDGTISKMIEMEFTTPESIIELTSDEIGSMIGSKVNGLKIFKSIRDKLTNIPEYKLMGASPAFGRGVGTRKMKLLWDHFSGDMTNCQTFDKVVEVKGFDKKTASKIVDGYNKYRLFYQKIAQYVTLAEHVGVAGLLNGKSYVFTGFRDTSLEARVVELGGKISSGVSKNTTAVVAANLGDNSTKLAKAVALQIPTMTQADFKTYINSL